MSAMDKLAEKTAALSSKTDDIWNLFTKGVGAYIDKETRADDRQAPGVEDYVYQGGYAQPYVQQQSMGASGGMNPLVIGGAIAAVVVVALVMRRRG